jgi:hypothetical protein
VSLGKVSVEEHVMPRMDYVAQFSAACRARDKAIKNRDVDEFFTMLTKSFASIESFLALRAHVYNEGKPEQDELMDGGNARFVSTQDKIKIWLPVMSGRSIDLVKSPAWGKFLRLQKLRNDAAIHPKIGSGPMRLNELATGINDFREAIAGMLFVMHQFFGRPVSSVIIRAMRYPEVRVVQK